MVEKKPRYNTHTTLQHTYDSCYYGFLLRHAADDVSSEFP